MNLHVPIVFMKIYANYTYYMFYAMSWPLCTNRCFGIGVLCFSLLFHVLSVVGVRLLFCVYKLQWECFFMFTGSILLTYGNARNITTSTHGRGLLHRRDIIPQNFHFYTSTYVLQGRYTPSVCKPIKMLASRHQHWPIRIVFRLGLWAWLVITAMDTTGSILLECRFYWMCFLI